MAASASEGVPSQIRLVSINKNGGNRKVFEWPGKQRDDNNPQRNHATSRLSLRSLQQQVVSGLRSTFLPVGFPSTTPPGYLSYAAWSWIQDISTQLRSVIATQRILEGVGVGREGATALSALFNYLVRDGFGMAATLLFTYAASSRFRTDCKRWRIFADVSVDVGITLEVTATLLPPVFFLPMICIGNVFKAMCGVAAGATGGSINLHWSKGSDISDINAKFGAQHTVTAALGLVFAGLFARSVDRIAPISLWTMYILLTSLHIFANMRCMRLICFDYLNTIRMDMILDNAFANDASVQEMSTPQEIARQEPLWFLLPSIRRRLRRVKSSALRPCPINFGISYDDFYKLSSNSAVEESTRSWQQYAIDGTARGTVKDAYLLSSGYNGSTLSVNVCLLSSATPIQQTKAYFHAKLLRRKLQKKLDKESTIAPDTLQDIEQDTEKQLEASWNDFVARAIDSGWDLNRSELQSSGYEIEIERV